MPAEFTLRVGLLDAIPMDRDDAKKINQLDGLAMTNRNTWILIPLFTALTAAGAWIRLPVPPVPFTLQTLFVYLAGAMLTPRAAAASQMLFLFIGLAGLPVFGLGGGPSYVLQPTFGYLLAFPLAAWTAAKIFEKSSVPFRWKKFLPSAIPGMLIIFGVGVSGLYLNLRFVAGKPIPLDKALWSGMLLFLPAEVIKMGLAGLLAKKILPLMDRTGGSHA